MRLKTGRGLKLLSIILPIVIILGFGAIYLHTYLYNAKERVCRLVDAQRSGSGFVFDDITMKITSRSGDTGSWQSDFLTDENGEVIYIKAIGTIYEIEMINNSSELITDWKLTMYIPEEMYINNTWNGDFEFHQFTGLDGENEKVQTINLAQFSQYDIELDHHMTSSGPMIHMSAGDYFVYYPNSSLGEHRLTPGGNDSAGGIKIGAIMYTPHTDTSYVINFVKGEISYHLNAKIINNPFLWALGAVAIIWIICFVSLIMVKLNLRRYEETQKRDRKTIEQTMQTLVNFIEAKDPSTMGHSLRVAQYSKMLAEKLGFTETECDQAYWIALMHDCGKLYIPDNILGKPGKLTDDEYEIMKKHTVYGGELLKDFTAIDGIGMGALCHHERYDGKGYPNGMAGDEIPMIARIICVADSFDAMNSKRCYRNSLPDDVILGELEKNKGKQFDPHVVESLLALIDKGAIKFTNPNKKSG